MSKAEQHKHIDDLYNKGEISRSIAADMRKKLGARPQSEPADVKEIQDEIILSNENVRGVDSMSGSSYDSMSAEEVQERLLVLTSKSSRDIASINDNVRFFKNVFVFFLIVSILLIIGTIGMVNGG